MATFLRNSKTPSLSIYLSEKWGKELCDNHRGISFHFMAGMIPTQIILNRIMVTYFVDHVYPESPRDIRAGRGTIDMIYCLKQIAEKYSEKQ